MPGPPGPIRLAAPPALSLPRRRGIARSAFEVSEASAAARESIRAIATATRVPFGQSTSPSAGAEAAEFEHTLRQLELNLAERERALVENEARLADLERDLAEGEALLKAREQLFAATRRTAPTPAVISTEERAALEQLRAELERQEASLKEAKAAVSERELFLDESEMKLFEKVQAQQEKEIEQEQRHEDLNARERRLREREAALDPQAASDLKAEDEAAKKHDEFRE